MRRREAANSRASGSPSRLLQIVTSAVAFVSLIARPGRTVRPRWTKRRTAGEAATAAKLGWIPASELGADELPSPIKVVGGELPHPRHAPEVGEHTDEVLRTFAGYDDDRIAELRASGAIA